MNSTPHFARRLAVLLAVFAALTLGACGGGGGGGGDNPQPPDETPDVFTVSGSFRAAAGSRIDGDVNDPNAAHVPNDDFATAQSVPNAARIGGYVNVAGTGPAGRSSEAGDAVDIYRMTLAAGQVVNLFIGTAETGDLDLELFDQNQNSVGLSNSGESNVESVSVPADGEYFVQVTAFTGFSNYLLSVSNRAAAQHAARTDADFVPGDVIVAFDESRSTKSLPRAADRAKRLGLAWTGGAPGRAMRFSAPTEDDRATASRSLGLPLQPKMQGSELGAKLETLRLVKAIGALPEVRYAEPNVRRYARAVPNDPLYAQQWHYPLINLPQAWDITTGSTNVIVAVLDTGVLVGHPDLQGNLDPNDPDGYDFISDPEIGNDGDGRDGNGDDPSDLVEPDGSGSYHGTHVAGTVASVSNNAAGGAGVCWNCKIMPIRVLGVGGGDSFDIQQGMLYAAGLPNDTGTVPAQRADILNMSLGGEFSMQSDQDVVNQVRAAGVIIIAAAGNSGTSTLEYPSSYNGVVSVAAVGPDKNTAPYSQFNSAVDVAAPGGNSEFGFDDNQVLSAFARGNPSNPGFRFTYGGQEGTSMATPHMAGVVALMKSIHSGLTPAELDNALSSGAIVDDRGAPGRDDRYGHGLINAVKAVRHAQELAGQQAAPESPQLVAAPSALDFGSSKLAQTLTLSNGGTGALTINAVEVSSNAPWLSIAPDNVASDGTGSYRVQADRSGLVPGLYAGTITARSTANDVSITVRMEVASLSTSDDAGFHYVLLVDEQADEDADPIAQVELEPSDGEYTFEFTEIPSGRYFLVAGTDSNNDGFICDEGEACGTFPTNELPNVIVVDQDRAGLNFVTGFEVGITADSSSVPKRAASRTTYPRH